MNAKTKRLLMNARNASLSIDLISRVFKWTAGSTRQRLQQLKREGWPVKKLHQSDIVA